MLQSRRAIIRCDPTEQQSELLNLTNSEKEILILQATWESIKSMLNYQVLDLHHKNPDSSIQFKGSIHAKYFNIILLDFLHSKIFEIGKNCIEALSFVIKKPQYDFNINLLQKAVIDFKTWLNQPIKLEHNGEARSFWFPSINQEISLKITRSEFIKICGNISKHNILGLDRQAGVIKRIFSKNKIKIHLTDALLIMDEFYDQFHDNLFNYHSSTIAEFLNNIQWGIYEYLQPLYQQSLKCYWDDDHNINKYRYDYPQTLRNLYVREIFWNLMNNIRSTPILPKEFVVTRYLKMRY